MSWKLILAVAAIVLLRMEKVRRTLRQTEGLNRHLQNAQKIAGVGSWEWDIVSNRVLWSDELIQNLGLKRTDLPMTYEAYLNYVHPDDRDRLRRLVERARCNGESYRLDLRMVTKDGEMREIDALGVPRFDLSGSVVELSGAVVDITDRKHTERRVEMAEETLRAVIETAPSALLLVDRTRRIQMVNRKAEVLFNYDRSELIGKPLELLVPGLDHQRCMELEVRAWRKDRSDFPAEVIFTDLTTESGLLVTAVVRDLTEKKRLEAHRSFHAALSSDLAQSLEYRENMDRLASLVIPDLADWCVSYSLNQEGLPILHSVYHRDPQKQHHMRTLLTTFPPDPALRREIGEVLQSRESKIWTEIPRGFSRLIRRIGVDSFALIPMEAHGRKLGAIGFGFSKSGRHFEERDRHFYGEIGIRLALAMDQARLYQEVQEAVKTREEVLSIVSHDLKNPLTTIQLSVQLMEKLLKRDEDRLIRLAGSINRSARSMGRLLGAILDFSKICAGTFTVCVTEHELRPLLESVIDSLMPLAKQKSQQLFFEVEPRLTIIDCDEDRIIQVLSNVVSNSIKFTQSGGKISVKAEVCGPVLRFIIADTGRGIAADELPLIFNRYWQAKDTSRQGTGLGLSIAKGIVEAHGGRIWAESVQGVGSTFYFTMPARVLRLVRKSA